jgi:hypothetical protein
VLVYFRLDYFRPGIVSLSKVRTSYSWRDHVISGCLMLGQIRSDKVLLYIVMPGSVLLGKFSTG